MSGVVTSKVIRLYENGGPEVLKLESIEVSAPPAGHVQIEQHAVGVNFIDIYFRTGLYKGALPHGLGFEAAGVVTQVGEDVQHLKVGDRVAYCQGPIGAYAQVKNHPASQVIKLPKGVEFDQAAASLLKGLTVQYLFRQIYRLQGGETILFHAAAGGVGLIACQWAKALGVKLIGTVSSEEKAQLAKAHGAWETIDYTREDVAARVKELTKGQMCPVVFDSVGKDTWLASLDSLQPRGLMVSFGNASGAVDGVNLGILAAKGSLFVTRPTLGTYVATLEKLEASAQDFFTMVKAKKIKLNVSAKHPMSDAAAAQIALASRKTTGAMVLDPNA